MTANHSRPKLDFIVFLRAFAAVMVLLAHLWIMFWYSGDTVSLVFPYLLSASDVTGLELINPQPVFSRLYINFGSFGVSIFFLITGFLINRSLERQTPARFLAGRALRIYPTYIVGFSLTFLCIWLYTHFTGQPFPYRFSDWLKQVSMLREGFWMASIDGVVWTLEAQVKFYLLIALLAALRRNRSATGIVLTGMLLAAIATVLSANATRLFDAGHIRLYQFSDIAMLSCYCMSFMLMGIPLYQHHTGRWPAGKTVGTMLLLYACFAICATAYSADLVNYTYGLGVFVACYCLAQSGATSVFKWRCVRFVADISYPLYIVHGLNGYILMTALYDAGIQPWLCFVIAVFAAFAAAWLLHRFVEEPVGRLASRWLRRSAAS